MSTEPWYECNGITYQDVCISLKMRLKSTLENKDVLDASIKEIVSNDIDFGSQRGYYTFIDEDYKTKVIARYNFNISNKGAT